jgi:hypothetical protein
MRARLLTLDPGSALAVSKRYRQILFLTFTCFRERSNIYEIGSPFFFFKYLLSLYTLVELNFIMHLLLSVYIDVVAVKGAYCTDQQNYKY